MVLFVDSCKVPTSPLPNSIPARYSVEQMSAVTSEHSVTLSAAASAVGLNPSPGAGPLCVGEDAHDLAIMFDPVLHAECKGRLGPIQWFRSQWQRGGAATGFASWTQASGGTVEAVVKMPVGPTEHRWTTRLGTTDADWHSDGSHHLPTPRVLAEGHELGGYDLAWLVMERLPGRPLAANLSEQCFHDLLRAAVDFQGRAIAVAAVEGRAPTPDWPTLIAKAKAVAKLGEIADAHRWVEALKKVLKVLPHLMAKWGGRSINAWCHGDLHPGNALRRAAADGAATGPCVLIDLALVHPGHWVEDAVYLERQFWGHPELMHGIKPVSELGRLRRERGLPANDNYPEIADVRRVLMASCAPAVLEREGGSPKYLHAALEIIERVLPQVAHH